MTGIWVDTDFGFDDLWALLLLRHLGCSVDAVSLVAGNAPLPQVVANAMGARQAYGLDRPLWQGAARPLTRAPETAERILGPTGMLSRGKVLPRPQAAPPDGAVAALAHWLRAATRPRQILALGPLTNIALLLRQAPELSQRIARLVWMGGSAGRGNHSAQAEFNALADPEAAEYVLGAGLPVDIVDLEFCRTVLVTEQDLPPTDGLTADLLGGYLDIGLTRGRPGMAIYDPLAAVAMARPDAIGFTPCDVVVVTQPGDSYGATRITPVAHSRIRIATAAHCDLARLCLDALHSKEPADGTGQ